MNSTVRPKIFYGWIVLAATILIYFSSCATIWYSYGAFQPTLVKELGWSRTALSGTYTTFLLIMGLSGPLVGISVRRFGSRKHMILGTVMAVIGLLGLYLTKQIWQFYLFYSVFGGLGFTLSCSLPAMTMLNNWFVRRRSLAIGLQMASGGVAGAIFTPLITRSISSFGWRWTWVYLAVIQLVLATVTIILVRNKPEDIGQVPDGVVAGVAQETTTKKPAPSRIYQTPVDWKVGDALRTSAVWLMVVFGTSMSFARYIITTQHTTYITELGFTPMLAATTLSLNLLVSSAGRLAVGALGLRFEMRHLAAACLAMFVVGMVILMNGRTIPLIYIYVILTGLSYGGLMVTRAPMLANYYGRKNYPVISGFLGPEGTIVSSLSPFIAGFIRESTGSYTLAFIIGAAFLGVGLVCALLTRPPKPRTVVSQ